MYYYQHNGHSFAALFPNLPLERMDAPAPGTLTGVLVDRDPKDTPVAFCVTDARQLTAEAVDVTWLDPARMPVKPPHLPRRIQRGIDARTMRAINIRHPRWENALTPPLSNKMRNRVNLLAVGDVGGTLLTALKLLGGDCIYRIGICDLNEKTVARWTAEMGQISWPWDYEGLPEVEAVPPERLFDCDVFIFAATRGIPAVDSGVRDVRMAQFDANRAIVESYARQAREAKFGGLFIVLSDPVDPLCKAAWLASNRGEAGNWDGMGLRAEQIQGFGLGVMNARAAYLAKQKPRFRTFLQEGRCFGPHGDGLIVANSIQHYDDALSRELTEQVIASNLRIRELGFKPYVAPAVSSGAIQLLLTLRGQWHCGSVYLGRVWFGVRSRYSAAGLEVETQRLPDALFTRLQDTERHLQEIV